MNDLGINSIKNKSKNNKIIAMANIKLIIDEYMRKIPGLKEYCDRCLRTERWQGNVVLMVIDASFTSIGLNYFNSVVPKVEEFRRKFIETGKVKTLKDLSKLSDSDFKQVWRNSRSIYVARNIASYLSSIDEEDKRALRKWAKESKLEEWKKDPIGSIKGVGLVTFQYLRMMGGIDTVMPDKIVKRVINGILEKAGYKAVNDDIAFIKKVEEIALTCGYRPIELCWMTWLIESEKDKIKESRYASILSRI